MITIIAEEIENYFSLSFYDAILIVDVIYELERLENKDELRKAVFQYAQRLENS